MIDYENSIVTALHCKLCQTEANDEAMPLDEYARLTVGYTPKGIQVWCERHNANVIHWDLAGRTLKSDSRARARVKL